ncbi:MAG: nucleotidyltransferase domain-containing protein [Acidobacteriota bacterium]
MLAEPLSPQSADLVAKLAAALGGLHEPSLVSAYLFGSQAEDRAHRESDIDVAVLVDRGLSVEERFALRLRLATELPGHFGGREVDVVVLNDAPPHLGRRAALDGIRVLCGDSQLDHDFRRDVQLRAADLEPFLRWTRALKLEALKR